MSATEYKELVAQLFRDLSAGNVDGLFAALSDDATWWIVGSIPAPPGGSLPVSGTKNMPEFRALYESFAPVFPNGVEVFVDHCIAEGDFVAAEGHSQGTTAKGLAYHNQYLWLFEIHDGKITAVREYNDTAHTTSVVCA